MQFGDVNELLSSLFDNYDTNVILTMTKRVAKLSVSSFCIMLRCVVAVITTCCLLIPIESSCDSDDSVAKLYREKLCNLPKITGSCKLKWKRFYYNRHAERCEQFVYEGETFCNLDP